MYIICISCGNNKSIVTLLKKKSILCIEYEENHSGIANDASFPKSSIKKILSEYKILSSQIRRVIFFQKPILSFYGQIENILLNAPRSIVAFVKFMKVFPETLFIKKKIINFFQGYYDKKKYIKWDSKIFFSEGHYGQACYAFYKSKFSNSEILIINDVSEYSTLSIFSLTKKKIIKRLEVSPQNSLNKFYNNFLQYIDQLEKNNLLKNFFLKKKIYNSHDKFSYLCKMGKPIYVDFLKKNIILFDPYGNFSIKNNSDKFLADEFKSNISIKLLSNICCSIQFLFEEIIISLLKKFYQKKKLNLCISGEFFRNKNIIKKIIVSKIFKKIYLNQSDDTFASVVGSAMGLLKNDINIKNIIETKINKNIYKKKRGGGHKGTPQFINSSLDWKKKKSSQIYYNKISETTTQKIKNFYKIAPFPNFNQGENVNDLITKAKKNRFLFHLIKIMDINTKFLEVGSGTSQLSIALASLIKNEVVAIDPTKESLELAESFIKKLKINNIYLINSDLFDNPVKDKYFDIVFCSGVLHHTKNPEYAFQTIAKWLKSEGLIIVGLYNKYGRFLTICRQIIYKLLFKSSIAKKIVFLLDPYLRSKISTDKKIAWFRDQYEHPVESLHTIDEVLNWFKNNDIKFLGSIPQCDGKDFYSINSLSNDKKDFINRLLSQIAMIFNHYGSEGGLFLMLGKKN